MQASTTSLTEIPADFEPAQALLALLAPPWRGREERVRRLLESGDLIELSHTPEVMLVGEAGLTRIQARRLVAAFALGRSVERERRPSGESLGSPGSVYRLLRTEMRGLEQETFHAIALDAKHRMRGRSRVSVGTLTTSLVHPREVFRSAIRLSAAALIVAHNHPSGDPEPSLEDLEVTRRLVRAGGLLGIPLLDHVVIGEGCWVSLRERLDFKELAGTHRTWGPSAPPRLDAGKPRGQGAPE